MTINQLLQKLDTASPILQATFGLERENLRVTTDGRLAQTSHPSQLGSRNFHPTIQTDFSEQQLELITPIAHSTKEARRLLGAISDVAGRSIDQRERLWPLSMPPQLTEEEIVIATGSAVDQQRLTGLQTCDVHVRDDGGGHLQQSRGGHEIHPGRRGNQLPLGGDEILRVAAAREQRHHLVADPPPGHSVDRKSVV